jgi:hypothetical protein
MEVREERWRPGSRKFFFLTEEQKVMSRKIGE